ncbi:hypothetical protein AGMMS50267_18190 [Spirochaetia bacterium]|nr:hypothetical protein AGMMS50267_18190 [Spirochaetia bacterium]
MWGFSPAHFCSCWKPTVSFIATAKTSYSFHVMCNFGNPKFSEKPIDKFDKKAYTKNGVVNSVALKDV